MAAEKEITPLESSIRAYLSDTSGFHPGFISELIQKRAYQLFEQRGRLPGHDMDDWLQAEQEIKRHLGF